MTTINARQQALLGAIPPDQRQQFMQLLDYLHEKALAPDGTPLAEGSVAQLLNGQTPEVRRALAAVSQFVEDKRYEPYAPKHSESDRFQQLGLDPDAGVTIKAALDSLDVNSRVIDRLGGDDSTRPPEPLTLRDMVAASVEQHEHIGEQS